ncbi:MAG: hypothetical protein PHS99_05655 [Candidatus Marinimicrobia bacterium]|nr:hypothetical protein [Candidatus Neomarinimicrobiota bacterium]
MPDDDYLIYGSLFYYDYFDLVDRQSLSLEINYKDQHKENRKAEVSATVSDSFHITSHPNGDEDEVEIT